MSNVTFLSNILPVFINMKCIVNMFFELSIICFITLFNSFGVHSIWPPPYNVNLSNEETFVISELLEKSDIQDVYDEEEMIRKEEMEQMNLRSEKDKYFRIHAQVLNQNKQTYHDYDNPEKKTKVYEEFNPDKDAPVPWKAGIVDEEGKFMPEKEIIYFDEEAKNIKGSEKQKRADTEQEHETENYDYAGFKADYDNGVKKEQKLNETVEYSTVKEEESVKDSLKAMVDFKQTPRNCTAEEMKGIGMGAVECFWMEANKPKMNNRVLENVLRVFIVWIVIYVIVAIPCWCQYGWCCCCCRFKFCRPQEQIDDVKRFTADNPIGVFHDADGNRITYKPTHFEKYAQTKLELELQRL